MKTSTNRNHNSYDTSGSENKSTLSQGAKTRVYSISGGSKNQRRPMLVLHNGDYDEEVLARQRA